MKDFVEFLVKHLVDKPDEVNVKEVKGGTTVILELHVGDGEIGKVIGKLLNRTRGQEMIASMITGFFADGIYQLIFLFMAGTVIPMVGDFILSSGMGLRNTIDLIKDNRDKSQRFLIAVFFNVANTGLSWKVKTMKY